MPAQSLNVGNITAFMVLDTSRWDAAASRVQSQARGMASVLSSVGASANQLGTNLALVGGSVAALLATAANSLIKTNDVVEQAQIRLASITGSAEAGKRAYQDLFDYAARSVYKFEDILASGINIASVMNEGPEDLIQTMEIIGDLAARTGLDFQKTGTQVLRMYSAGAQAADMFREKNVQVMMGFIPQVRYTAEETKKKVIEFWNDTSNGLKGLAQKLNTTWTGIMGMIADKWFALKVTLGQNGGIYEPILRVFSAINSVWDDNQAAMVEWIQVNAQMLQSLVKTSLIVMAAATGITALGLAIKASSYVLSAFSFLLSPVVMVLAAIAAGAYLVRVAWLQMVDDGTGKTVQFGELVTTTFTKMHNKLAEIFNSIAEMYHLSGEGFKAFVNGVIRLGVYLGQALEVTVGAAFNTLGAGIGDFVSLVSDMGSVVGYAMAGNFSEAFSIAKASLLGHLEGMKQTFSEGWASVGKLGSLQLDTKTDFVGDLGASLPKIKELVLENWEIIKIASADTWETIKSQFGSDTQAMFDALKDQFPVIDEFLNYLQVELPNAVDNMPTLPPADKIASAGAEYREALSKVMGDTEFDIRNKMIEIQKVLSSPFMQMGSYDQNVLAEKYVELQKKVGDIVILEELYKDANVDTTAAIQEKITTLIKLKEVSAEGSIEMMNINKQLKDFTEQLAAAKTPDTFFGGMMDGFRELATKMRDTRAAGKEMIMDLAGNISGLLSRAWTDFFTRAKTGAQIFQELKVAFAQMVIEMIAKMTLTFLVSKALQLMGLGVSSAAAATTAAAWAPAAALTSLAMVGTNAVAAQAAIMSTIASAKAAAVLGSYEIGTDYVPKTGLYVLHQGEAVLTAEQNQARIPVNVPPTIGSSSAEDRPITIINNIVPEAVAMAMEAEPGQNTIINTIGRDALSNGPTRRNIGRRR